MKLFKNFKTKKELRKEIATLKGMLSVRPHKIVTVEKEVEQIACKITVDVAAPREYIKRTVISGLAEQLEPFIRWDIQNDCEETPYEKSVTGKIWLCRRK